jgi:hypothetical protein
MMGMRSLEQRVEGLSRALELTGLVIDPVRHAGLLLDQGAPLEELRLRGFTAGQLKVREQGERGGSA